jgi:folate-dependent phosphoribosylglycinamide formyltransferase PurN
MLRLGWLTTARGPGSRGFFEVVVGAIESGTLDARIEYVFSNRERGEGEGSDALFDLVTQLNIPLVTMSSRRFRRDRGGDKWLRHREAFHAEAMRLIADFDVDVCVLAGYMLVVSDEMTRRLNLLNLHPALPDGPEGTWQQVIWELIGSKASRSGVMVHVATEVLDGGPVLAHCGYPIKGGDYDALWDAAAGVPDGELHAQGEEQPLFAAIRHEGIRRERPLLLETLRALASGGLHIASRRVTDERGQELPDGLNLDAKVDAYLSARASLEPPKH